MPTQWTPLGRVAASADEYHEAQKEMRRTRAILMVQIDQALAGRLSVDVIARAARLSPETISDWRNGWRNDQG